MEESFEFTLGGQIIILTLFFLVGLNLLILTIHILKFPPKNNTKDVKIMHKKPQDKVFLSIFEE